MKFILKKLIIIVAAAILSTAVLPACTGRIADLDENERASIYGAVITQLYTVDHTHGSSPPDIPVIYLIQNTNDKAGDPQAREAASVSISTQLQNGITDYLDNLPADVVWIDHREDAPMDNGSVVGNGVIITLGNIYSQGFSSVRVAGSIYFSGEGGGGATYALKKRNSVWEVTGKTGTSWIS